MSTRSPDDPRTSASTAPAVAGSTSASARASARAAARASARASARTPARAERRRLLWALRAFLALWGALLVANDLLPYGGFRDDSCQTMFSTLRWAPEGNNHLFMPQRMVSDIWSYWTDVEATLEPPAEGFGRARLLSRWLNEPERALNAEAVRAVIDQLCARGHRVRFRGTSTHDGARVDVADACAVERLSAPHALVPVRLYETDLPADAIVVPPGAIDGIPASRVGEDDGGEHAGGEGGSGEDAGERGEDEGDPGEGGRADG